MELIEKPMIEKIKDVLVEACPLFIDKTSKNNKRWFVTPSEMIINGIEKLSF